MTDAFPTTGDRGSVPGAVREAALAALAAFHNPHVRIADLVHDSVLEGARGVERLTRALHFVHDDLVVQVELHPLSDGLFATLKILPPEPAHVDVRQADRMITVDTDPIGKATVLGLRPGLFRLLVTRWRGHADPVASPRVATVWVRI